MMMMIMMMMTMMMMSIKALADAVVTHLNCHILEVEVVGSVVKVGVKGELE